jgi:putative endonuclease
MIVATTRSKWWLGLERWGLQRLDGVAARRGRTGTASHLETGLRGEREALFHMRGVGYVMVARRWTNARLRGDIDLIGWDGEWLSFIEVKTRTARDAMEPAESAVDERKKDMLRKMAKAYLKGFPRELRDQVRVRFDVVSVYLQPAGAEFEVWKGAFGWE